jgi:hypothetical protein
MLFPPPQPALQLQGVITPLFRDRLGSWTTGYGAVKLVDEPGGQCKKIAGAEWDVSLHGQPVLSGPAVC